MAANARTAEALARFASNSKLLALLDAHGIERLAHSALLQSFPAGLKIVNQGDAGDSFYLIVSGEVRVLVEEAGGKEMARLGAGMFFGEIAMVTRQPRSATVESTQNSELIRFDRGPVMGVLNDYPKLREFLTRVSLHRTEKNMEAMMDDEEGLAALLEGDD